MFTCMFTQLFSEIKSNTYSAKDFAIILKGMTSKNRLPILRQLLQRKKGVRKVCNTKYLEVKVANCHPVPLLTYNRLLWKGSWFIQEKSSKILTLVVSARSNKNDPVSNGEGTKKKIISSDDVLKGLVEWLVFRYVML
ncbi:hypothetical protein L1987_10994 [Smallanthus sonchifolius]|uniref:Uncharacterized protein n=1 Tax=Smallanthus sonchifolius TaxID=185202 RepID=A0ACB9JCC0_9ASTR|nr:hypothetical protein L1987_10994 [Smallanthus sonchifolius]